MSVKLRVIASGALSADAAWKMTAVRSAEGLPNVAAAAAPAAITSEPTMSAGMRSRMVSLAYATDLMPWKKPSA
jgi:hypothetical protein